MFEEAHPGPLVLIWFRLCSPGSVPVMLLLFPRRSLTGVTPLPGAAVASNSEKYSKTKLTYLDQGDRKVLVHLPATAEVDVPLSKALKLVKVILLKIV